MQILFLWDTQQERNEDLARTVDPTPDEDPVTRRQAIDMADGTWNQRQSIDQWVERLAPQWPPRRQPPVDRNILRLGIWELTNTDTPPKVVLDEAIEMARQFSTEQSPAFVNGVLDAVLRENKALTQGSGFRVQGSGEGAAAAPPPLNPEP